MLNIDDKASNELMKQKLFAAETLYKDIYNGERKSVQGGTLSATVKDHTKNNERPIKGVMFEAFLEKVPSIRHVSFYDDSERHLKGVLEAGAAIQKDGIEVIVYEVPRDGNATAIKLYGLVADKHAFSNLDKYPVYLNMIHQNLTDQITLKDMSIIDKLHFAEAQFEIASNALDLKNPDAAAILKSKEWKDTWNMLRVELLTQIYENKPIKLDVLNYAKSMKLFTQHVDTHAARPARLFDRRTETVKQLQTWHKDLAKNKPLSDFKPFKLLRKNNVDQFKTAHPRFKK